MRCFSRGVCLRIYSPVGFVCAVGSNRLNQGPRLFLKGGGGSFHKGEQNPTGVLVGARVGPTGPTWRPLAPPLRRLSSRVFLNPLALFPTWRICFCVCFALESLFSAFPEIHPEKYRIYKTRRNH